MEHKKHTHTGNAKQVACKVGVSSRSERGFTLIELLVVVAIIGLLSSTVLASLNSARERARDVRRVSDMKQLLLAFELFYDANGRYPNSTDGVSNGGEIIGVGNPIDQALESFMSTAPKDPRHDGSVYFYSYDPVHCTDSVPGACDCGGSARPVLAFNKAETSSIELRKDTCSGGNMNQHNADYNIAL